MPSIYISEAEREAIRLSAAQATENLSATTDPELREKAKAHLSILLGIERKFRQAQSTRQLKSALRQRYRTNG